MLAGGPCTKHACMQCMPVSVLHAHVFLSGSQCLRVYRSSPSAHVCVHGSRLVSRPSSLPSSHFLWGPHSLPSELTPALTAGSETQLLLRKSPGRHPGRDWGLSP